LVSDFRDSGWDRALKVAARRHDLIAVVVGDPAEDDLPGAGLLRLADAEAGGGVILDTSKRSVRSAYAAAARARRDALRGTLHAAGADAVEISTAGGHLEALVALFRRRERRR